MEERKQPIKVRLGIVVLLFIILILVIVIIGMFCYYDNSNKSNVNQQNNIEKESVLQENKEDELNTLDISKSNDDLVEIKNLDINSDLVQKLYKYILKYSDYEETLVYQSQKVTKDTMNNKLKLMTIFENLNTSDADEIKNETEYGMQIAHTLFKKETVERKAREIFGSNITVTHEQCPIYFANAIDYQNGTYNRYDYQGGGRTPWESSISQIKSAKQRDDEIYIYDKYIHVYDEIGGSSLEEGIYTASDKKTKISDLINISVNSGMIEGEQYSEELFNKYEEKLGNKIKSFKHTFKKNDDGTYYWYSTEPIE